MKITLSTRNRTNAPVKHIRVSERAPTPAQAIRIIDEDLSTFETSIMQKEDNLSYYAEINGFYDEVYDEAEQARIEAFYRDRDQSRTLLEQARNNALRTLMSELFEFLNSEPFLTNSEFLEFVDAVSARLERFIYLCDEYVNALEELVEPEELEQERSNLRDEHYDFWTEARTILVEVLKARADRHKVKEALETARMQSEDKE